MKTFLTLTLCAWFFAASCVGCKADRSPSSGDSGVSGADAGRPVDAGAVDAGARPDGGSAGGSDAGAAADGGGCLSYAEASTLCGFSSDDSVCAFSVGCGTSDNDGQCKINCEMGTTVRCYTAANVTCLRNAVTAASCDALRACAWIL